MHEIERSKEEGYEGPEESGMQKFKRKTSEIMQKVRHPRRTRATSATAAAAAAAGDADDDSNQATSVDSSTVQRKYLIHVILLSPLLVNNAFFASINSAGCS